MHNLHFLVSAASRPSCLLDDGFVLKWRHQTNIIQVTWTSNRKHSDYICLDKGQYRKMLFLMPSSKTHAGLNRLVRGNHWVTGAWKEHGILTFSSSDPSNQQLQGGM